MVDAEGRIAYATQDTMSVRYLTPGVQRASAHTVGHPHADIVEGSCRPVDKSLPGHWGALTRRNLPKDQARRSYLWYWQSNVVMGYRTLFAYFKEHENGVVSADRLREAMGLQVLHTKIGKCPGISMLNSDAVVQVKCGSFSYAEIPRLYDQILGVTGTLESLGDFERTVIEKEYAISGRSSRSPPLK